MEANIKIFLNAKEKIQEQLKSKFEIHRISFLNHPLEADSLEFQEMVDEISHCSCELYMRTLLNYNTVKKGPYILLEPSEFLYAPYADRVNFAEGMFRYVQGVYRTWYEYTLIGDRKAKNPEEFIYWSVSTLLDVLADNFKEEFASRVSSMLVRGGNNFEVVNHKTVQTVKQLLMEVKIGFNKKIEVWHNTGFIMPGYGNLGYRYFVDGKQVDVAFKANHPVPPLHFDPKETAVTELQDAIVAYFESIRI